MMNDDVKTVSATDRAGKPRLCVVVPCYNEEEVLPVTCSLFKDKVDELVAAGKVAADSSVLFVDDGSKDSTWDIIARLAAEDARFEGLKLSRNRGHQNALLAGLMEARRAYDVTISIDCDGQDDVNAMNGMIDAYLNDGCEIVYGVRSKRDTDTAFKRSTAEGFYRVLQALGVEVVFNHADYRLMSKRALDAFSEFKEVNLFLRGMVPLVGFSRPACTTSATSASRGRATTRFPRCSALPSMASPASR